MNLKWMFVAAAPALTAPLWWPNQDLGPAHGHDQGSVRPTRPEEPNASDHGLMRLKGNSKRATGAASGGQSDAGAHFDGHAWRQRLTVENLDERLMAFDEIVGLARGDRGARAALEAWAKDDTRPDLSWTSRLALRDLAAGPAPFGGGLRRAPRGNAPGNAAVDPFSEMEARMRDLEREFGGLDSLFDDLQQQLRTPDALNAPPSGKKHSGRSFSMQSGPDGVKVKITESVDGKDETKEYSAKDLDELLALHPELESTIGSGAGGASRRAVPDGSHWRRMPLAPWWDSTPPVPDADDRLAHPLAPTSVRTDVLGILAKAPTEDVRKKLALDADVGLLVDGISPGTIAEVLGLERGDVVIELNGRAIRDASDIKAVLTERADEADVSVVVVNAKGERQTLTWAPPRKRGLPAEKPRRF